MYSRQHRAKVRSCCSSHKSRYRERAGHGQGRSDHPDLEIEKERVKATVVHALATKLGAMEVTRTPRMGAMPAVVLSVVAALEVP